MTTAEVFVNLGRSNTNKTEREEWGLTNCQKPTLTEEKQADDYYKNAL